MRWGSSLLLTHVRKNDNYVGRFRPSRFVLNASGKKEDGCARLVLRIMNAVKKCFSLWSILQEPVSAVMQDKGSEVRAAQLAVSLGRLEAGRFRRP